MSDAKNNDNKNNDNAKLDDTAVAEDAKQPGMPFRLINQHVVDLSYEFPGALELLTGKFEDSPPCKVEWRLDVVNLDDHKDWFLVKMYINIAARSDDRVLFLLELTQGGVVVVSEQALQYAPQITAIEIPRLMFPFARRLVTDLLNDCGINSFNLEPFDFLAAFEKAARQQQESNDKSNDDSKKNSSKSN